MSGAGAVPASRKEPSPQMIPEAAGEAAFLRIADHLDDTETESWKDLLRLALEAAAPHMLAGAWRAGEEAGQDNADSNRGFDIEHKRNPYEATP